jgi:protein-tyrosine phosphatase
VPDRCSFFYPPVYTGFPVRAACPFYFNFVTMKLMMVCLGNICRSPLAEGILQHKAFTAGLNWSIESAGTNSYHTGEPPHPLSQKVAREHGIDISRQRARRFRPEDFTIYDRIYALAEDVREEMKRIAGKKYEDSKVELLMNELYPGKNMNVPDPWYGPESGYHQVYQLIDQACDAIILKYAGMHRPGIIP